MGSDSSRSSTATSPCIWRRSKPIRAARWRFVTRCEGVKRMARKKPTRLNAPDVCPVCGEDVPRGSLACPECGADHNSGWRQDVDTYDAVDLPDEEFNYDEFVREKFRSSAKPAAIKTIWWITAILVTVAFIAIYFYAAH